MQEGDEEEETDKLVQQVFAEIGISATEGLVSAPQQAAPAVAEPAAAEPAPMAAAAQAEGGGGGGGDAGASVDDDLAARLDALRKG